MERLLLLLLLLLLLGTSIRVSDLFNACVLIKHPCDIILQFENIHRQRSDQAYFEFKTNSEQIISDLGKNGRNLRTGRFRALLMKHNRIKGRKLMSDHALIRFVLPLKKQSAEAQWITSRAWRRLSGDAFASDPVGSCRV